MREIKKSEMKNTRKESEREQIWKITLVVLIVGLGLLLFKQARIFLSGILGAFTLFVLLRRHTYRLQEKIGTTTATSIVITGVVLFIMIPLSLLVWYVINRIQNVDWSPESLLEPARQAITLIQEKTGFDILSEKSIGFIARNMTMIGHQIINGIGGFIANILACIIILFFMLSGGKTMEKYLASVLPFNEKNKKEIVERVHIMVRSNAIGIPLLALIQGLIAFIGYLAFGVPNAALSGILTGLCSMVPVVGTMLVWIPISIYFMALGLWGKAIGLIIFGAVIISQSDNLIRFILQKKMANTHPLITIFGVIAGVPIFGFLGIIFGPILVSLFLMFLDMFRKEYLDGETGPGITSQPSDGSEA